MPTRSERQSWTKAARTEWACPKRESRYVIHLHSCCRLATSQGQAARFLNFQPSVLPIWSCCIFIPRMRATRQRSRNGSACTARCRLQRFGATFVIRIHAVFIILSWWMPLCQGETFHCPNMSHWSVQAVPQSKWRKQTADCCLGVATIFSSKRLCYQTSCSSKYWKVAS